MPRSTLRVDVRHLVLHEAGYKCGNPICRTILTLDIHHLDPVSNGGGNAPENLLALCPTCHALHHSGVIPQESLRAWKMLILAVNEAFDRRSIDLLLALDSTGPVMCNGEGVLECAALISTGLAEGHRLGGIAAGVPPYSVMLTDRGRAFVAAWKKGDQRAAVELPRVSSHTSGEGA
jgi:hypothetical protein